MKEAAVGNAMSGAIPGCSPHNVHSAQVVQRRQLRRRLKYNRLPAGTEIADKMLDWMRGQARQAPTTSPVLALTPFQPHRSRRLFTT